MIEFADLIIAASGVIFSAALVPTVINQYKARASTVPLTTSLTTSGALLMLLVAYVALGLWFATTTIACNLVLWLIVMVQRVKYTDGAAEGRPSTDRLEALKELRDGWAVGHKTHCGEQWPHKGVCVWEPPPHLLSRIEMDIWSPPKAW